MNRLVVVLALALASSAALAQPLPAEIVPDSSSQQALAAERDGKMREAIRLYTQLARKGDGKAALRIAEIYEKGLGDVGRDETEAAKWYNAARVLGQPPLIGDFPTPRPR
jgi:TPR repeat protein